MRAVGDFLVARDASVTRAGRLTILRRPRATAAIPPADPGLDVQLDKARDYHLSVLAGKGMSRETARLYGGVEDRFIAFLRRQMALEAPTIAALTPANVTRFADWLGDERAASTRYGGGDNHRSAETIAQYVAILKHWSSFLVKDGWIRSDPLSKLPYRKRHRKPVTAFTLGQVDRMILLASTTRDPLRNRAICLFLLDTGVRVSELVGLRAENVALAKGHEPGRAKVLGKGARERYVYFGAKCSQAISRYSHMERSKTSREPYLFLGHAGQPLTRTAVLELVKDLGTKAGIEGMRVSPHVWRHCFAVNYLRANPGQLEQLRRLLGHSQISQVTHYAHLAQADLERHYTSLGDLLGRARSDLA